MELVEGTTLAERLAQAPAARAAPAAGAGVGPRANPETSESASRGARASGGAAPRALNEAGISLDEALDIARQIVEALEAAHEKGIIHRDLKPANIALTPDAQVKVLDFGLAKALEGDSEGDPSTSPTLTAAATRAGVIIGTAAYMSPEQARGKPADKRSDIWAFWCVLYEMLTGKRPFEGEDVSDTLAAVLRAEPDIVSSWFLVPRSSCSSSFLVPGALSRAPPRPHARTRCRTAARSSMCRAVFRATTSTANGEAQFSPRWPLRALLEACRRQRGRGAAHRKRRFRARVLAFSTDGRFLAYGEQHAQTQGDVWVLPLEGERKPRSFLKTPFEEWFPAFSPDARWIAYESNESGRPEIYMQPFPGPGGKVQISTDGGKYPLQAPTGRELFYRNGDRVMAVSIETAPAFHPGTPQVLFDMAVAISGHPYDPSPDAQRFVMIVPGEAQAASTSSSWRSWRGRR